MQKILTVLVLYKTSLRESAAYQSLTAALVRSGLTGNLFVYDNSPEAQTITPSEPWTIQYVHDSKNPGVSKAYNVAFGYAEDHGMDWLLLCDQDTFFPENAYDQYLTSINANPEDRVFTPRLCDERGLVSPFKNRLVTGGRLVHMTAGKKSLAKLCAINSGLFIHLETFRHTGGYDERLRLDFSDFSFFRKLSSRYESFVVVELDCLHQLSAGQDARPKDALNRFSIYLEGSRIIGRELNRALLFACYAAFRAVRLSFKYRSLRFVGSLLPAAS